MAATPKVIATDAALELIETLKKKARSADVSSVRGGSDGSAPMCYPRGELTVGDNDVMLGKIGGCPIYIGAIQYKIWEHTQLIIDVVPGRWACFLWKALRASVF